MSKEMINTNKAVLVRFPAHSSQGTASIYIPFPVKEIHVKGVDIDWEDDYGACMFSSSLFNDGQLVVDFVESILIVQIVKKTLNISI